MRVMLLRAVTWSLLAATPSSMALGQSAGIPARLEAMVPADTLLQTPQAATAKDMQVFEPYIGRFRSRAFHDDDRGLDLHYFVEYRWVDSAHSVVRFRVWTRYADGTEVPGAEGYYGYDPFHDRLYVLGVFAGTTGFGAVGEFDPSTRRRVTWARSWGADGVTTYVRDAFEVVDGDRFNDVTLVRRGEDGPWQVVYRDTFTRVGASGD